MPTTKRTYPETHPWLTFEIDLRRASYRMWMLLGEAVSKCFHIARVPLRPATFQSVHLVFLAKGVHGTTAIEGNTLSEDEVRRSIEGELTLPPSKEYLRREVDNIVRTCNRIGAEIQANEVPPLSVERICWFNRQVLEGLELEEGVVPGVLRDHEVTVAKYLPPRSSDCPYLLARMCEWLGQPILDETFPERFRDAADAIIRSILAHLYVAWIHPFGDGNGRAARMLEFQVLLEGGLPTPVAHLLSNHYNKTRTEYYRRLDRARDPGRGVPEFLEYALQGFVDGQQDALQHMWFQQLDTTWRSHVYQQLKDIQNKPGERIRRLAFAFEPLNRHAIPFEDVPELTPKVARTYARLSGRTLRRDLRLLVDRGVLHEQDGGYRANIAGVLRWLPQSKLDLIEQRKSDE